MTDTPLQDMSSAQPAPEHQLLPIPRGPEEGQAFVLPACLANLKPGEPYFVLRAQDAFAPIIVKLWAELCATLSPTMPSAKIREARVIAMEMQDWPDRKYPD